MLDIYTACPPIQSRLRIVFPVTYVPYFVLSSAVQIEELPLDVPMLPPRLCKLLVMALQQFCDSLNAAEQVAAAMHSAASSSDEEDEDEDDEDSNDAQGDVVAIMHTCSFVFFSKTVPSCRK